MSNISRRTFLKGLGAALVVVAGGTVYRAVDNGVFSVGQGPAYEPWRNWREATGTLALVSAAILAANPHNRQPWLFRVTDNSISVYVDHSRNVGKVDPFYREIRMGVGAALENLMLAAEPNGYQAELTLAPDPDDETYAAEIALTSTTPASSELYEAIPNRRTNRAAYDRSRTVDGSFFEAMTNLNTSEDLEVFWFTTPEEHARFSQATVDATAAFTSDPEQNHDSESFFRTDWQDIQANRDNLTIDAQNLPPVATAFVKILPFEPEGTVAQIFRDNTRDVHCATAAAFGIVATRSDRDLKQHLECGMLYQRIHLWATTQGLAMQPLSQLRERVDREAELGIEPRFTEESAALLGTNEWQGTMPFRIGYPTVDPNLSPRRAVEDVLI
jgi:hypothetical protein